MVRKETYECQSCKRTAEGVDTTIPHCCGKSMKKIPREICLEPAPAEHACPMEDEDVCDEFRKGL